MGDIAHLDLLFALTVADINGTNPELWNSWRASLLRQLYYETKRALRRGLENVVDKQDLVEERQALARQILANANIDQSLIDLVWSNAGDDYFLRESATDIAWHTVAIANNLDNGKALVLVKDASDVIFKNATQIFIHAKDRDHVFALVTAVLEQHHLSIVDARVYSSNSGYILDTFFVLDSNGQALDSSDERLLLIQQELKAKLDSDTEEEIRNNRRIPRQLKFFAIPTSAQISQNPEKNCSVLEVIAADRPGLLATIADIFVEYDIALSNAKISTLGERVEDIFFIADEQGNSITDPELCKKIEHTICQRLDEQVAETAQ
jgi:[protein-PII] uridylyltransferase